MKGVSFRQTTQQNTKKEKYEKEKKTENIHNFLSFRFIDNHCDQFSINTPQKKIEKFI